MSPLVLPDWPAGTVGMLATAGGAPHVIPVSTIVRAGDDALLLGLSGRRASLARLRRDPRVALAILAAGDLAVTVHGVARVLREAMACNDRVVALRLDAVRVQDHMQPRFSVDAGVAWHWTNDEAREMDAAIRAELAEMIANGFEPGGS
jgi:hypothetical protein